MTPATFLLVLTLASWVFWIVACLCVRQFALEADREAGSQRPDFAPPVSLLKPVRGLDAQAYKNFRSFCEQTYPQYEVLFGLEDPDDPVRPVLDRLRRECPPGRVEIVIAKPLGANAKVSNLYALASAARYDILVMSDSDMRVTPDYLQQVVAALADTSTGIVTCCYRGSELSGLAAHMAALYCSTTYMPAAVVAWRLFKMPVAFGSTMVVRRSDLESIGGFAAIADHLADDYQLASRVQQRGKRVVLSPYVVQDVRGAESWRAVWEREVRWIRCVRASRPMEYPGLLLSFSLPLAIAAAFVMGFDTLGRNLIVGSLLVRWATTWLMAGYTHDALTRRMLAWLPLRDLLSFVVWCDGVIGREVEWRGKRFVVQPNGLLQPIPGRHAPLSDEETVASLPSRPKQT